MAPLGRQPVHWCSGWAGSMPPLPELSQPRKSGFVSLATSLLPLASHHQPHSSGCTSDTAQRKLSIRLRSRALCPNCTTGTAGKFRVWGAEGNWGGWPGLQPPHTHTIYAHVQTTSSWSLRWADQLEQGTETLRWLASYGRQQHMTSFSRQLGRELFCSQAPVTAWDSRGFSLLSGEAALQQESHAPSLPMGGWVATFFLLRAAKILVPALSESMGVQLVAAPILSLLKSWIREL